MTVAINDPLAQSTASSADTTSIQTEFLAAVQVRMRVLIALAGLSSQREEMGPPDDLQREVREELDRQERELKRMPNAETAKASAEQTDKRIEAMIAASQKTPGPGEPPAPPPPSVEYMQAVEIAKKQWTLLCQRDAMSARILPLAAKLAAHEPLYRFLKSLPDSQADELFGWAVYCVTLTSMKNHAVAQFRQIEDKINALGKKDPALDGLKLQRTNLRNAQRAITSEQASLEPMMVNMFWKAYEDAAAALACDKVPKEFNPHVRAMLRYGMIGGAPWFLPEPTAKMILEECTNSVQVFDESVTATYAYYADEYLEYVGKGYLTPAIDEDIELNQMNTPRWKQDKAWRRKKGSEIRIRAMEHTLTELAARQTELQARIKEDEAALAALKPGEHDYQSKKHALRDKVQSNRVEVARLATSMDVIKTKQLPDERHRLVQAEQRFVGAVRYPRPDELARWEVVQIRRVARLCAKLRDAFLPFTLRDDAKFGTPFVNTRASVLAELANIEKCDPIIFKDIAVPAKKASNRVYIRYCPYFLILPSFGIMSFALNPRDSTETGRVVIPGYGPRPDLLRQMMMTGCSDFRWDTSKEAAGMDVLTSDTLVAAYCTVRWDYRKKHESVREKAGIYQKENDRKNFRRHYQMYMASAMEGGKRLFFSCPEVYAAFLKYLQLPDGVKKLERQ